MLLCNMTSMLFCNRTVNYMSDFNKSEYDKLYNKTKRKPYSWNLSVNERADFDALCTKLNVNNSAYLKSLVNDDAIRRGLKPIFAIRESE